MSYHQQQNGLHRLTADLAGVQFNDQDALTRHITKQAAKRSTHRRHMRPRTPRHNLLATDLQTSQQQQQQIQLEQQKLDAASVATEVQSPEIDEQTRADQQQEQQVVQRQPQGIQPGQLLQQQGQQMQSPQQAGLTDETESVQRESQLMVEDNSFLRRFKLLHLLGKGNYSRVYKSVTSTGREIAIKAINLNKISDNYRQKFLPRELVVLKRLNHMNICKTHEIIKVYDRIYIIMQFCPRGTIADLLHRIGPLNEPVARFLFCQTLEAVNYMHSIDIAHRDLKVENILLTNDFTAKLTDFSYSICLTPYVRQAPAATPISISAPKVVTTGSGNPINKSPVRSFNGIKLNETFCGTLPYLSPEMMRLSSYDAKRTDIWSLGVSLFVMINDRLPFPFNDPKTMFKKQMSRDYKFRPNCEFTEQLKELMSLMLEPEWSRRPSCLEVSRHNWCHMPKEKPPN